MVMLSGFGRRCVCVAWGMLGVLVTGALPAHGAFVTFESGQVRPLALSPDGCGRPSMPPCSRLFAVNTPDDRLEIFSVSAGGISHTDSVPVGLEPVAVAAQSNTEVWVVNHLSDSISIVDVGSTPPRVTRTLLVGDEPRDIVFAGPGGNRAFITCGHRGQNSGVHLADLTAPGLCNDGFNDGLSCTQDNQCPPGSTCRRIGRADVWVFDATNLGSTLGGSPLTIVTLFGDTPRALAASPDGNTVYAAVFHSGDRTTTVSEGLVCDGGASASPCTVGGTTYPGGLPVPNANIPEGIPGPETGLIVKFNPSTNHWEDRLGRDWSPAVRFSLPDKDVFAIDAAANPPVEAGFFTSVGTIIFNMVVNPVSGKLYVSNTEARNEVRFEGPGGGGSTVRGHLHEARISVLSGSTVTPRHLNKHINYSVVPSPIGTKDNSLASPVGMAVSSNGATLYVAAFGSSKIGVFNTTALENDTFVPNGANYISVSGGGPSGLVLDEAHSRLYVLTRFDNGIAVVDTVSRTEVAHPSLYNPEPPKVVLGRSLLYDAFFTSSNGEASCASCHIFGDFDSLAWDLGNPDDTVLNNPNPIRLGPFIDPDFHPLKGPMTTQSLRGMANHGPMHWRGDRTGGNDPGGSGLDEVAAFKKFNVAFGGLLGRSGPLSASEMQAFTDFILEVTYPPNPIRPLDNSLTPDQDAGRNFFLNSTPSDTVFACKGCHVLDRASGFFGSDGFSTFEGESQIFKVAHLRNLYQKVGMFGMPAVPGAFNPGDNGDKGDQVRGFGILHDGSVDTVFRFHTALVFNPNGFNTGGFANDTQRRQVEQFMLAFDSNLFPVMGQQITLTDTDALTVDPRIDLLIARAGQGECDLTVKGTQAGQQRGWYRTAVGTFQSDRNSEAPVSDATLRTQAATPGQELTYTCVPPGSGVRVGVDRDEDGYFDRTEIDAGTDPADPSSAPEPTATATPTITPTPSPTPTLTPTPALICASGSLVEKATLRVSKNLDPPGDETLRLKGEWQVTTLIPTIDLVTNGFSFRVLDTNGAEIFRGVVPGGPGATTGWTVNSGLTRWKFKDPYGTIAGGITKIVVWFSSRTPGLVKFRVTGKFGVFQVTPSEVPVQFVAILGGAAQASAGQCASRAFSPTGGLPPACKLSTSGSVLSCR